MDHVSAADLGMVLDQPADVRVGPCLHLGVEDLRLILQQQLHPSTQVLGISHEHGFQIVVG